MRNFAICIILSLSLGIVSSANYALPLSTKASTSPILEIDFAGTVTGKIEIGLHMKTAPKACAQIMKLVREHFYDHQKVFKVLLQPQPYLVQMGDPATKDSLNGPKVGSGGSGTKVPYENSGFKMEEGAVALATVPGYRDTGDSQFFILLGDYSQILDGTATVFGKVTLGMDLVKKLRVGDVITGAKIISGNA